MEFTEDNNKLAIPITILAIYRNLSFAVISLLRTLRYHLNSFFKTKQKMRFLYLLEISLYNCVISLVDPRDRRIQVEVFSDHLVGIIREKSCVGIRAGREAIWILDRSCSFHLPFYFREHGGVDQFYLRCAREHRVVG